MVITYDYVGEDSTDITIRLYPTAIVSVDYATGAIIIPERVRPLAESLSCGRSSCHTWTSKGGLQMSTESLIGNGNDYAIILLASSPDTNSDYDYDYGTLGHPLQVLAGDSFRLGDCHL